MKRSPLIIAVLLVLTIGVLAQVSNVSRIVYKVDARTIASNGTGAAATLTLTPTGSYVAITCSDPDTCAITMGESSIPDGMPVTVVNMSTNYVTFALSSGVFESPCPVQLRQYETLSLIYRTNTWVAVGLSPTCRWTVTLTDAQIKALPTTPITLIAAPPSGYRIKVLSASLVSSFAAGVYTNIDATYAACSLFYLGDFGQWPTQAIVDDVGYSGATRFTAFFGNTTRRVVDVTSFYDAASDGAAGLQWVLAYHEPRASMLATALAIGMDNDGTGNLTGGNAANTLRVTVYWAKEEI